MAEIGGTFWLRLLVITLMLAVVGGRLFVVLRGGRQARGPEPAKLNVALAAELAAVRDLYEENLCLIAAEAGFVLSARTLFVVYRAHLNRLTVLDEKVIPLLVAVHAWNERIEGLLAARWRLGGSRTVYRLRRIEPMIGEEIKRAYLRGCAAIDTALAELAPHGADRPDPAQQSAASALPVLGARPGMAHS